MLGGFEDFYIHTWRIWRLQLVYLEDLKTRTCIFGGFEDLNLYIWRLQLAYFVEFEDLRHAIEKFKFLYGLGPSYWHVSNLYKSKFW